MHHKQLLHNRVNKHSYHAVIVLSANAHISPSDGYMGYFREITEGDPFIGSVRFRLVRLLFCFPHVVHRIIPEVRVWLSLGEETKWAQSPQQQNAHHATEFDRERLELLLTNLLTGQLPPLYPLDASHHYFMCGGSTEGVFRDTLGMSSVGVGATSIPILSQFQVGYGEGLCAKTWCQVFQSRDVLVHNLVGAQPPFIHSVLLKCPHKVCKHPPDPDLCQEVVSGNVFGETFWNAV